MSDMSADHSPSRGTPRYGRLLTVSAGLGVALLAAAAFAVTYADLRALALAGGAARRWAPAYPVMIDALITVTVPALLVARRTRWWSRALRWLLLAVLLVGAASASVQRAVEGYAPLPDTPLKAGVAVAPYVTLALAIWLWLAMFKQLRAPLARPPKPEPEPEPEPEPTRPVPPRALAAPTPRPRALEPAQPRIVDELAPAGRGQPDGDPEEWWLFDGDGADVEPVRERSHPGSATQPNPVVPADEDSTEPPAVDRAEDPDAGDDEVPAMSGRHDPASIEWQPPAGNLRSSPTPPKG
jgi:uncharacterized protein DUF2637